MIKNILGSAFIACGLLMAAAMPMSAAQAADGPVILVFDADRAIALSKVGKSMAKQLEQQVLKVRGDEEKVVKELQDELEKLKEQQKVMSQEILQKRVEELRQKELERRQSLAETTQSIQAGGQKAGREVLKVAEQELSAIAKERKADIVMRRDAVFFASPAINVTQELVKRLDKQLSSVKVTPIAQTKAKR